MELPSAPLPESPWKITWKEQIQPNKRFKLILTPMEGSSRYAVKTAEQVQVDVIFEFVHQLPGSLICPDLQITAKIP